MDAKYDPDDEAYEVASNAAAHSHLEGKDSSAMLDDMEAIEAAYEEQHPSSADSNHMHGMKKEIASPRARERVVNKLRDAIEAGMTCADAQGAAVGVEQQLYDHSQSSMVYLSLSANAVRVAPTMKSMDEQELVRVAEGKPKAELTADHTPVVFANLGKPDY